ncbi:solute carrier organic anion transporter family member 74D-like [Scylla paramamosain]|uniref:solute carrier organic anion transporter family member 74D-like n=1 Tax=Scylla paramamosain TaxID=85552 RepID=UPI003082B54A
MIAKKKRGGENGGGGGGDGGGGGTGMTKEEEEAKVRQLFTTEDYEETRCGLGPCTPSWLQRFATKEMYMLVYCLVGVTQGMFFTYSVSVISTIEKRFKLKSKETGIILAGNDISQVLLAIFLSYYGTFGHRPRWLAVGALFTAASCFTASLPHFFYGAGTGAEAVMAAVSASNATGSKSAEELCHTGSKEDCSDNYRGSEYVGVMIMLFLSQFFVGISISLFYSIGVSYLDDNINKKTYPLYYTLTILLRILGPVLGFMLGARMLSYWIDPSKEPNISKKDPRWLGAWWLGLVFLGAALVVSAIPLFFFPRKLPATLRREGKRYLRQAEKNRKAGGTKGPMHYRALHHNKKEQAKPTIKNLGKALKRLFTNKIWFGYLFSSTVTLLALSGYWNFKPKYLENQFRKSATEANYYTGMASLVVSVVGSVVSGSVMRWGRPGPRLVTGYNIFITLVSCVGFVILMFLGCPKLDVVGPVQGALPPACSADCECSAKFTPICSQDGRTLFYSPCYAGCLADNITAKPVEYSQCKCIDINAKPHNTSHMGWPPPPTTLPPHRTDILMPPEEWGTAQRGYCPEPCNAFFYYLLTQIIIKTISSTGHIGASIVLLRAVSEEDKGLSLGAMTVFISLFAFIPAPIIMGAIIDSACVVWETSCGVTGNCWLYDSDHFRRVLHLVPAVLLFISIGGEFIVFLNSHKLDLYGLKDDEVEDDEEEDGKKKLDEVEDSEEGVPLKTDSLVLGVMA